jgi:hypothetical protein
VTRVESFAVSQIFRAVPCDTRENDWVRNWASVILGCS